MFKFAVGLGIDPDKNELALQFIFNEIMEPFQDYREMLRTPPQPRPLDLNLTRKRKKRERESVRSGKNIRKTAI